MKSINPKLESYLKSFFKSTRVFNSIIFALDIVLLFIVSFLIAFILFEFLGYYSVVRILSWIIALFFTAAIIKRTDWRGILKKYDPIETASAIEASLNMDGRLVSAVEFSTGEKPDSGEFDTYEMKQFFINEVISNLSVIPKQSYNTKKTRIIAVLFFSIVSILMIFPGTSKKVIENFISMKHTQKIFSRLDYPKEIFQDSVFTLKIDTDAYRARVNLEHDDETYVKKLKTIDNGFLLNLDKVSRRLKFTLYLEKPGYIKKIGPINVNVLMNLFVESMTFNIKYPDYLSKPPEKIKAVPYLELPNSTIIKIRGRANSQLRKVVIKTKYKKYNASVRGDIFSIGMTLKKSIDFKILLLNQNSIKNKNPVSYRFKVLKDLSPKVRIISPQKNILANRRLVIPLVYEVWDDIGLRSLIMEYGIAHKTYIEKGKIKIPFTKDGFGEKRWIWNLNSLPVSPGEHINYKLVVTDLAGQKAQTAVYKIRLPSIMDLLKKSSKSHNKIIKELKTLLKEKRGNLKRIDDLIKNNGKDQRSSLEKEREIQKLLRQHRGHVKKVKELLNEIKKEKKRLSDRILFSPKTLKKLMEIRKYLKKLHLDMMPKYKKRLNDLLKNKKMSRIGSLRNIKKKMLSQLSNLLKALKKLSKLRDLEAVKNIIKSMKEKSTKIAMRINMNQNYKKAKHEFKDIKNLAKNIQNRLKDLANKLKDHKSKKGVSEILKSLKNLKNLKNSKTFYRNKKHKKASYFIKTFLQKLTRIQKKIKRIIDRYQRSGLHKMLDLVRLLITDFVSLADEIEHTRKKFIHVKNRNSRYSSILKRAVNGFITELGGINKVILLKMSLFNEMFSGSMINLGRINIESKRLSHSINKIINAMQNMRLYAAPVNYKNSIFHIGRLSYNLLFLLDKLKSNMKKSESGKGEYKQGLNSLAEAQRRLDSKLSRLFSKMSKGKLSSAEMEYLKNLSLQQQIIRQALQDYGKSGSSKKTGKFLGDISGILKEMMEIEKKLLNKKLNKNIMQMEKRILKRLLNASRSLKTRGFKDKYRAEKPDENNSTIRYGSNSKYIKKIKHKLYRFNLIKGLTKEERKLIQKYYRILMNFTL